MTMSPVGNRSPEFGLPSWSTGEDAVAHTDTGRRSGALGAAIAGGGADDGVQLDWIVSVSGTGVACDELVCGVGVGAAPIYTGTETDIVWPATDEEAQGTKSRRPLALVGKLTRVT